MPTRVSSSSLKWRRSLLVAGGYSGFMSSEWEGHAFADLDESDPIDLIAKQHELIRRAIRDSLAQ